MVDNLTKDKRSKIMRSIKSKDTKPELIVRKLLTQLGYRYRLHRKDLPGKPDIAFISRKKAVFVHGCFWHGHLNCKISHIPESEFWRNKLSKNQERDLKASSAMLESGWETLIVWECELTDINKVAIKLLDFLTHS